MTTIKQLKKGDYFKLRENGRVYVRGDYNRSIKKYEYYDYDDICNFHVCKGTKIVITDFEF